MIRWLVDASTGDELERGAALEASATVEQRRDFSAVVTGRNGSSPLVVAGDVGEIAIVGLLTARPSFVAWLLGVGNTVYSDVQAALAQAAADPTIKRVVLAVNSPGGQVDGLFDCLAALESFTKPISTRASFAASAAYAIASLGGKITATGPAATFGSIGVAASFTVDPSQVDITSTAAPNKRPDVSTPEGQAVVRAELDDLHALFADAIARGRGTTVARVNAEFGRGGVVLAAEAKKRGMVDAIAKTGSSSSSGARAAAPGSQLAAAQALIAQLEQPGPAGRQLQAAQRLAATLGSETQRGAGETAQSFATRLLAPLAPPAQPEPTLAQKVAAIVIARNRVAAPTPKDQLPPTAAAMVNVLKLFGSGPLR